MLTVYDHLLFLFGIEFFLEILKKYIVNWVYKDAHMDMKKQNTQKYLHNSLLKEKNEENCIIYDFRKLIACR